MSCSASSVAVYGMLPTNTEREPCDPLDMLLVCPLGASQFITLLLCAVLTHGDGPKDTHQRDGLNSNPESGRRCGRRGGRGLEGDTGAQADWSCGAGRVVICLWSCVVGERAPRSPFPVFHSPGLCRTRPVCGRARAHACASAPVFAFAHMSVGSVYDSGLCTQMSVASWASDVYDYGAFGAGIYGSMALGGSNAGGSMAGGSMYGTMAYGAPMLGVAGAPVQQDIRGVGITFDQERDRNGLMRVYVRRIRPGTSAAENPSIAVGCTLVTVGGKNVYGLSLTTLRTIVPGPAGTSVKLGFQADTGDRVEVSLTRSTTRGMRASNPVFKEVVSSPQIGLGDEAGTFMQREMAVSRVAPPGEDEVPAGWERKKDPKGFIFWVNHAEKKISYTNPAESAAVQPPFDAYGSQASAQTYDSGMPTTQV